MSPHSEAPTGQAKEKLVEVSIDGHVREIEMRKYTTEELISVLGVKPGYLLSLKDGNSPLKGLSPGETIQVHPHMTFYSQAPAGNWS